MATKTKTLQDVLIAIPLIGNNNWLGGENYIRNIVGALATLPPNDRPRVRLTSAMAANAAFIESLIELDFVEVHPFLKFARINFMTKLVFRVINRFLRLIIGTDYNIEYHNVDLIYPVMSFIPDSIRSIYWIGDFQEIFLPQLFSKDQLKARHEKNATIISSRNVLVLSSQSALDDLRANFSNINAKIHIWRFCSLLHLQASGGKDPYQTYNLPAKYAYIPNQFWAHKNHEIAFRALGELKKRFPDIHMVCTGSTYEHRVKGHFEKLKLLMTNEGIVDNVTLLGIIPREDQIEIMRHAAFILQPSLFEGWSTVVEDTRTLGRPIVLSNLAVHVEQNPPNAIYFDPHDKADLAQKLEQAWLRWSPGPDHEAEKLSKLEAEKRQIEAGREFQDMIRDALELVRQTKRIGGKNVAETSS